MYFSQQNTTNEPHDLVASVPQIRCYQWHWLATRLHASYACPRTRSSPDRRHKSLAGKDRDNTWRCIGIWRHSSRWSGMPRRRTRGRCLPAWIGGIWSGQLDIPCRRWWGRSTWNPWPWQRSCGRRCRRGSCRGSRSWTSADRRSGPSRPRCRERQWCWSSARVPPAQMWCWSCRGPGLASCQMWCFVRSCRTCTEPCKSCPSWSWRHCAVERQPCSCRRRSVEMEESLISDITSDIRMTYHRLGVAVLAAHGQVKPKGVAVDHVHVAGLRST